MKKPYDDKEWDELRNKIIGLGENSTKRSYYPELQNKLAQLEKFKILLDNFVDGLIVVNLNDGIVEDANKSALNLLTDLKVGKSINPVFDGLQIDNREKLYEISKSIKKAELENYDFNAGINLNGENKILEFRINVQKFGNIQYAVIHVSDITEKENSIQAVKSSEANLHALIENTRDIIWSVDKDFRLVSMNSNFKRYYTSYLGYEPKIGERGVSVLSSEIKDVWENRYKRALKGEQFKIEEHYNIGFTDLYCIIAFSPIIKDEIAVGVTVIVHDISDRIRYELAIKQSETQLRKIIENSPTGIVVAKNNVIDYANSSALSIYGYRDIDEVKNRSVMDFISPDMNDKVTAALSGLGTVEKFDVTGIGNNKKEIPLFASTTNIDLYDGPATIIFFDDVSKQKEVEQTLIFAKTKAEESEKLKSEFLAQVSHEIRTPINTILSFSNLIHDELKNVVSSDLKSSFEIISIAGKRIIRTIDLILNMSEIQIGTYEVNVADINLYKSVLLPLANEYSQAALLKGIELIVNAPKEDIIICGDEYTIVQIFSNLIDNAIKYTEKGFVKVYESKNLTTGGYSIIVEDSGLGISKEYLPSLFNSFSQEDRGYTRRFEGNGLGLALVKKYCDLNNAEIFVRSEKNTGSKFIVAFKINTKNK